MSRLNFVRPGKASGYRAFAMALAIGAMAVLAGCGPSGLGGGFGGGPAVRASQPVTGQVLGTGNIRVALLVPMTATGNAGQIAANFRNAAELALKDFKSANIQVMVKDDQGTPEGARAAASEAISQGAELILGPLFARSVPPVATVARAANVPVIAFSSDSTAAIQGVYLLSFLPQSDVDRIVSFAASRGKHSFAALLPDNAYGTVVESELQRAASGAGVRVLASQHYSLDKTAMQTQATSLAGLVKSGSVDADEAVGIGQRLLGEALVAEVAGEPGGEAGRVIGQRGGAAGSGAVCRLVALGEAGKTAVLRRRIPGASEI